MLRTGRACEPAGVEIDGDRCTGCGLCVQVCKGIPLYMEEGRVLVDQSRMFGCIACGQCMAVCPEEAIRIEGRDFSPEDVLPIPGKEERADHESLLALMRSRRSVRSFARKEVERELVERIVEAVATAPMGLPPSDVEILVVSGRDKVQIFAEDIVRSMRRMRWFFGPVMRLAMYPFGGRVWNEVSRDFLLPVIDTFVQGRKEGSDHLFYDAPLVLYFHASPYADPLDPAVAATYAMLAAQSIGLGTCMIGTPSYFFKYDRKLKAKYSIPKDNHQGIALIAGHPKVRYGKTLRRRLAGVRWV